MIKELVKDKEILSARCERATPEDAPMGDFERKGIFPLLCQNRPQKALYYKPVYASTS